MKIWVLAVVSMLYLKHANCVSVEQDLTLSLSEKQALDKFRSKVQPILKDKYMKTDIYLIRWLRAKNFNINDAETMLKENLKWRKENKIDTIHLENFDDMKKDCHTTVDTQDKQERPIGVVDIFSWDIREQVLEGKGPRLLRYLDYLMENLTDQVFERQEKGLSVTQWTILANTEGFNMITHGCPICIPVWVRFVHSLETHFPGWLDELIVIEAPQAVHLVLEILKPFLSKYTRDAIHIFPPSKSQWMPYMDARVSRDQRREMYGGTKSQ